MESIRKQITLAAASVYHQVVTVYVILCFLSREEYFATSVSFLISPVSPSSLWVIVGMCSCGRGLLSHFLAHLHTCCSSCHQDSCMDVLADSSLITHCAVIALSRTREIIASVSSCSSQSHYLTSCVSGTSVLQTADSLLCTPASLSQSALESKKLTLSQCMKEIIFSAKAVTSHLIHFITGNIRLLFGKLSPVLAVVATCRLQAPSKACKSFITYPVSTGASFLTPVAQSWWE